MSQTPGGESLSAHPQARPDHDLMARIRAEIDAAGGWLPFDRYMALALYAPGLGYYARGAGQFGSGPAGGSDFTTAPEMTPLFGRTLARAVEQMLEATGTAEVVEFGAGSGALAEQLLQALGDRIAGYSIVDLSGSLRARQSQRLAAWGGRVRWLDAWPERIEGVVVGNEVLDAMPVQLLHWDGSAWHERGVAAAEGGFVWADRATALCPPHPGPCTPGTVTEIHPQAEAYVRTLATKLQRGAAFFVDYGFPEAEYYHPQRRGGTLMCHHAHRAQAGGDDPLADPGSKDITAHVNFSAVALAAQDAGLDVLGYTTQAHFLLNCGIAELLQDAGWRDRAAAQRLLGEHEMGELFKVLALGRGVDADPLGFAHGDRSHTL